MFPEGDDKWERIKSATSKMKYRVKPPITRKTSFNSHLYSTTFLQRQCALIHIEQVWDENRFTVEGKILHERVDNLTSESRKNFKVEFSVPIRSLKLGLIGKADVVEFNKVENCWIPYPVEYKHGKPKIEECDRVQLCAQAICLEEMMKTKIEEGAIYYGIPHRRQLSSSMKISDRRHIWFQRRSIS